MWVSNLDSTTRARHQHLDGQKVDYDDYFESGGEKALGPGLFSSAKEVINWRCKVVNVVEGYDPPRRRASVYDKGIKTGTKLVPYTNYKEWKKANEIKA